MSYLWRQLSRCSCLLRCYFNGRSLCVVIKDAIHTQLNWAIFLFHVTPDGKTELTAQFWLVMTQSSELSFPVVFHTQNCAVHLGNPTVSSVYLPTPRLHLLKALNSFSRWASHDIFLFKYQFLLYIPRFLFFFWDNIMADVASKQQTTALFLSTTVTRIQEDTELTKKTDKTDGKPVLCQRTFSSVFFVLRS